MRGSTTTTTITTVTRNTKAPRSATKRSAAKSGGKPNKTSKSSSSSSSGSMCHHAPRVVHISNPMWVKVAPSEFRDLVQDLTGRHAAEWPHHPRWIHNYDDNNGNNNNNNSSNNDNKKDNNSYTEKKKKVGDRNEDGGGTFEAGGLDVAGVAEPMMGCFGLSDLCYGDIDGHDQTMLHDIDDMFLPY